MSNQSQCLTIVCFAVVAYFAAFPDDTKAVAGTVSNLTAAIPNALYGVLAVGILAWAVIKTWGTRAA